MPCTHILTLYLLLGATKDDFNETRKHLNPEGVQLRLEKMKGNEKFAKSHSWKYVNHIDYGREFVHLFLTERKEALCDNLLKAKALLHKLKNPQVHADNVERSYRLIGLIRTIQDDSIRRRILSSFGMPLPTIREDRMRDKADRLGVSYETVKDREENASRKPHSVSVKSIAKKCKVSVKETLRPLTEKRVTRLNSKIAGKRAAQEDFEQCARRTMMPKYR